MVNHSLLTSHDIGNARELVETLKKSGSSLVAVQDNLVDLVWGKDRPQRPSEPVKVHPDKFAGKPFQEKIEYVRQELAAKKSAGFVIRMVPLLLNFIHHECLNGG